MKELLLNSLGAITKAALVYTVPLAFSSFFLGLVIALLVVAVQLYGPTPLKILCRGYVVIIRGTPLLIQLFLIFYALPRIGIVIAPIPSAIIGLSIHAGAYSSEIIRASLEDVPQTLREVGLAVGFTRRQIFFHILVPHAAFNAVPPLFNNLIDMVKSVSLASIILVPEIMRKAQEYAIVSNRFLLIYTEAAVVYLVICLLLEWVQRRIEARVKIDK